MAKNNRKYTTDSIKTVDVFEDEYEDYGYEVQNAKRYSTRQNRQTKFKDYDQYDDWS